MFVIASSDMEPAIKPWFFLTGNTLQAWTKRSPQNLEHLRQLQTCMNKVVRQKTTFLRTMKILNFIALNMYEWIQSIISLVNKITCLHKSIICNDFL